MGTPSEHSPDDVLVVVEASPGVESQGGTGEMVVLRGPRPESADQSQPAGPGPDVESSGDAPA